MTTAVVLPTTHTEAPAQPVVAVRRRTIDRVLIALGGVAAIVLAVAGGLLTWGSNFADDYVADELSSQNIFFPDAAALEEEGRTDLVGYADEQVTTGDEAEAYASFINGHLQGIADGATYADLGGPRARPRNGRSPDRPGRRRQDDADDRRAAGQRRQITGQRDTLFKGETLRGLLLSTLRLVDDRQDRRHRRHRRLRRRRRDGGAGGRRSGARAPAGSRRLVAPGRPAEHLARNGHQCPLRARCSASGPAAAWVPSGDATVAPLVVAAAGILAATLGGCVNHPVGPARTFEIVRGQGGHDGRVGAVGRRDRPPARRPRRARASAFSSYTRRRRVRAGGRPRRAAGHVRVDPAARRRVRSTLRERADADPRRRLRRRRRRPHRGPPRPPRRAGRRRRAARARSPPTSRRSSRSTREAHPRRLPRDPHRHRRVRRHGRPRRQRRDRRPLRDEPGLGRASSAWSASSSTPR